MNKKASLRVLAGLLVILVAFTTAGIVLIGRNFTQNAQEDVVHSLQEALKQLAINLDNHMRAVDTVSFMLIYDTRMQKIVNRQGAVEATTEQLEDISELRELIAPAGAQQSIDHIRLYLDDNKWLSREGINFFSLSDLPNTTEYPFLSAAGEEGVWIGAHARSGVHATGDVLTLARSIRSIRNYDEIIAWLLVDMQVEPLIALLDSMSFPGGSGLIFVTDQNGTIALNGNSPSPDILLVNALVESQDGLISIQVGGILYTGWQVPLYNGWNLCAYAPSNTLLRDHGLLHMALVISVVLHVLLLLLSGMLLGSLTYTQGVRRYIELFQQKIADAGLTAVPAPAQRDIYKLESSLNALLETIERLTDDAYQARLKEREAMLHALQAQINPHFLYNTLDTIQWKALRSGAKDISEMVETLARYFRLSLNKGNDLIPISEELSIVEAYLTLQAERFDHEFTTAWEIEEGLIQYIIPKLTLQPLVENALLHGLRRRREAAGGKLYIRAWRDGDDIRLSVTDNGPGLNKEPTLPFLSSKSGYGIENVCQRLEIFSSGCYSLDVGETEGGGVVAMVRIPMKLLSDIFTEDPT